LCLPGGREYYLKSGAGENPLVTSCKRTITRKFEFHRNHTDTKRARDYLAPSVTWRPYLLFDSKTLPIAIPNADPQEMPIGSQSPMFFEAIPIAEPIAVPIERPRATPTARLFDCFFLKRVLISN
jgi:hypothetical protein